MPSSLPTEEEITQEYRGLVSAISHRMIQNPEMAKDAAQKAWMEILKSCAESKKPIRQSYYSGKIIPGSGSKLESSSSL
jgi:hypothetical protein